jgi:hypothetical protein
MIHKCDSIIKGDIGNYSPVYTHLKTGGCHSIIIKTIEESPSDLIRLICDSRKAVTIFSGGIRKVPYSCEFGEVWINGLGTSDVSVFTSRYILSIRDP